MLPEPTLPRRRRAAPAQPWAMTPLFAVPESVGPESAGPRSASPESTDLESAGPGSTHQGSRANRRAATGRARKEPDLLALTAERLRRALGRSFLRYGVCADLETAVHAAMNVIEPVLDARDTEILRLRRLMGAKLPGRSPGR